MIYAYMRVSTLQQTLENQHYALLKFADQRGLRVDAWITESSSGAKAYTERALGQLLAQLRPQDTVRVAEISRLGRRLLDILQIVHRLMDTQVTLISVKAGLEVGNTLNGKVLAFAFGLALGVAVSFGDPDAAAFIEGEGDRLMNVWLGDDGFGLEAGRQIHLGEGLLGGVGGGMAEIIFLEVAKDGAGLQAFDLGERIFGTKGDESSTENG